MEFTKPTDEPLKGVDPAAMLYNKFGLTLGYMV